MLDRIKNPFVAVARLRCLPLHATGLALVSMSSLASAHMTSSNENPPSDSDVATNAAAEDDLVFTATWKDGLNLQTGNKLFKMKIGGRIQNDWSFMSGDSAFDAAGIDLEDGTEFRRARLSLEAEIYESVEMKAQYDFATGTAEFRDLYIGFKEVLGGTVRVGQQYEPMGLETETSSNQTTFIERSLADGLAPMRNTGILYFNTNDSERVYFGTGVFRDTDNQGVSQDDGKYNATARVTGLPVYANKGEDLVHVGVSASLRNPNAETVNISMRPETHLADNFITTGAITDADKAVVLGGEIAWVNGPFSMQGEYIAQDVSVDTGTDAELTAWYAYVSYFLTGQHRPYKMANAVFDKITVERPHGRDGGKGAWEVALRYSNAEFNDVPAGDDELSDITAGLNWYLNTNTRIMFNYVLADLDSLDETANLFTIRFAFFM